MPSKNKSRKPSEKWQKMMPFLPCFFDVPSGDVQVILSISHHTLDPMRRAVGLDKWPYLEVSRGQFCMTDDEIRTYRDRMMGVADDAMKKILKQMAKRAEDCRTSKRPLQPMKRSKTQGPDKKALCDLMQEDSVPSTPPSLSALLATHAEPEGLSEDIFAHTEMVDAAVQVAFGEELGINPEQAFWDEISQILMEDATPPDGPEPSRLYSPNY